MENVEKVKLNQSEKFCGTLYGGSCPLSVILESNGKTFVLYDHASDTRDHKIFGNEWFGEANHEGEMLPKLYWSGPIHEAFEDSYGRGANRGEYLAECYRSESNAWTGLSLS